MATVSYVIKKAKDPVKVYARFRHGADTDLFCPTGLLVNASDWNKKKQEFRLRGDVHELHLKYNDKLNGLSTHILKSFNEAQVEGTEISKDWLDKAISQFFDRPTGEESDKEVFFIPFVEYYIERARTRRRRKTGSPISNRTILDYKGTVKKLKHFEEIKGRRLKHKDINLKFHDEFLAYCEDYHGITNKTIGGEIDNIKLFLRQADLAGYEVSNDYKRTEFYSPDNKTHDIVISEEEVQAIFDHPFEKDSYLDNARDWFIIGLWTGLRVGDLLKLSANDINDGFFELENRKTGIPVVIPIHPQVQATLNKRDGEFPRPISSQRFNEYLKQVSKEAGLTQPTKGAKRVKTKVKGYGSKPETAYRKEIGTYPKWELCTSHLCRRYFATYHYGKLDTLTVMACTGHRTERQFLDYVKITPRQHAERMKELWRRMSTEITSNSIIIPPIS